MSKMRKSTRKTSDNKSSKFAEQVKEPTQSNTTSIMPPKVANQITEKDILSSTTSKDLVEIINSLTNNKQDEIFKEYKQKTKMQLKQNAQLIKQLQGDLDEKQKILDNLLIENNMISPENTNTPVKHKSRNTYESPIRSKNQSGKSNLVHQDQLAKELENIGITLDMMELLTGLRIINYKEDETKFYFDVKQNSTNDNRVSIEYRLVISKKFESTAEINYIPTFLEAEDYMDKDEFEDTEIELKVINCKLLRDNLPEYLCDNLSFPYSTLSQFYNKVNRALHKVKVD